jgi:hypothetical protein
MAPGSGLVVGKPSFKNLCGDVPKENDDNMMPVMALSHWNNRDRQVGAIHVAMALLLNVF